jgi:hypothetical protein
MTSAQITLKTLAWLSDGTTVAEPSSDSLGTRRAPGRVKGEAQHVLLKQFPPSRRYHGG